MLNSKVFCLMMVVVGAAAAPVAPAVESTVDWTKDDFWEGVDRTILIPTVVDSEETVSEEEPEMHILPFTETTWNVPTYPIATPSYAVPDSYYSSVPAGSHVGFPSGWLSGVPRPTGTGWYPKPTGWFPEPTGYISTYTDEVPTFTSEFPTATASAEPTTVPNPPVKGQTVVYIGQRKGKKQHKLDEVCADPNVDIAILSFLHLIKGSNSLPASDMFALCNDKVKDTDLATCADWEDVINTCQQNGKKVLLSIGGATMKDSFDDPVEGPKEFAKQVWDLYGEGSGLEKFRPYGKAVLDGFDMDIENHHPDGWVNFAKEMKAHFKTGTKEYLLTAAPQCPRPDASLLDAVYEVDHLYIQFYNNESCGKQNIPESFGEWSKDILAKSPNTKLFVGLPGAEESAIKGYYMSEEKLGFVEQLKNDPAYGGLMTWDYVDAVDNKDGDFVEVLRALA